MLIEGRIFYIYYTPDPMAFICTSLLCLILALVIAFVGLEGKSPNGVDLQRRWSKPKCHQANMMYLWFDPAIYLLFGRSICEESLA